MKIKDHDEESPPKSGKRIQTGVKREAEKSVFPCRSPCGLYPRLSPREWGSSPDKFVGTYSGGGLQDCLGKDQERREGQDKALGNVVEFPDSSKVQGRQSPQSSYAQGQHGSYWMRGLGLGGCGIPHRGGNGPVTQTRHKDGHPGVLQCRQVTLKVRALGAWALYKPWSLPEHGR